MFDWNDDELTNIIWDEAGESDDHIVPYPDQVEEKPSILFGDPPKKEKNQRISNASPPEVKNSPTRAEDGVELDSNCINDTGDPETGFDHTSWSDCPDPSLSNVAKAEPDTAGAMITKNIAKSSEHGSIIDETAQFKKDSEIFENPPEDGEQGDFVDYGWANIGSFDDLDRIFSNQDPLFGNMSAGHADELWSPSKDVTSSPLGTTPLSGDSSDPQFGALRASIGQSEVKAEYMLDSSQTLGYKKLNEITSHAPQDVQASLDIEHFGGKSNLLGKEKSPATSGIVQAGLAQHNDGTAATPTKFPGKLFLRVQANRQKRSLKGQKLDKKNEVRQLHNLSGTWSSSRSTLQQVNGQCSPSVINPGPPLVLTQQSSLPRPEPFQQKYFSGAPLGTPLYGSMVNHYPMTSVLPQFHPGDENHELMSSSYEVPPSSSNSIKNSDDAAVKPPAMTPREKIEKLRRRQQMRAILAIQKQQLQFGNQVSVSENTGMEGGKNEVNESLGTFPSLEPSSPAEQYDSNTISTTFDNCSVEESVLYHLQDTIAKLDNKIRLCIRDSLSRLAQSAFQRQYHNDTGSTCTSSRDEVLGNKDLVGHERFTTMADVETDTNPIDRMVAHLLFHRPLDFSGKPSDAPDSPLSPKLSFEKKANPTESLTRGHFAESFGNTQITSPPGSKTAGTFSEGNQSKNCPAFVTFENASNTENTDGVRGKVETSN
ncbi:protein LNK2 isoform X3 [Salvia miltiorrhiza]|uniref:protein LNK2 isoform X3 n=1 Tax=Salvia miltiorrhiza TaxID=226208 RepID=UPI0025AC7FB8|nr:protein LNK2 isoform X3 [Salvia miltiorrhiza]XP_057807827.1 protein LNK2 isoform X3 [Salvia miltiorrhiza]